MPVNNDYKKVTKNAQLETTYLKQQTDAINRLIDGKSNNCGEITLANASTSTTVNDPNCNPNSVILIEAITAHAAAVTGRWTVPGDGSFVFHHTNPGFTDATFRYVIIG